MSGQSYDYLIAPKASFEATADAIRAVNGTNSTITWGQDGFADAIGSERKYTSDDIAGRTGVSGDITITLTQIETYAFYGCTGLTGVSAPNCTNIKPYAFYNCLNLDEATFSASLNTLGANAFYGCAKLEGVDFSNVSAILSAAFRNASVKNCLFNPTSVADSGFRDVLYWNITKLPRLTTITGSYGFAGMLTSERHSTVTALVFPALTTVSGDNTFSYNSTVEVIDLGPVATIQSEAFRYNTVMDTLILRRSTITALSNINAFNNSPFASGKTGGTLYVPNDLIASYQSATNWSTILGYTTNSIQSIEDSQYENYYADGTPIPTT